MVIFCLRMSQKLLGSILLASLSSKEPQALVFILAGQALFHFIFCHNMPLDLQKSTETSSNKFTTKWIYQKGV